MHADHVLAPEIHRGEHGERRRRKYGGYEMQRGDVKPLAGLIQDPGQVQSRADAADRSGQDVIEHQRRNRDLGERSAHRLVHDFVNAAAHEHAAALDIDRPHGVREQHDREDEPGRRFADLRFGDSAGVVGRGCEIAQHDGRRSPEGDERQHHRGRDNDLGCGREPAPGLELFVKVVLPASGKRADLQQHYGSCARGWRYTPGKAVFFAWNAVHISRATARAVHCLISCCTRVIVKP